MKIEGAKSGSTSARSAPMWWTNVSRGSTRITSASASRPFATVMPA